MKTTTPKSIGHGTTTFGRGYTGPAADSTLLHQQQELARIKAQRHPTITTPALEEEIAALEKKIADRK